MINSDLEHVDALCQAQVLCDENLKTRLGDTVVLQHWPAELVINGDTQQSGEAILHRSPNGVTVEKEAGTDKAVTINIGGMSFVIRSRHGTFYRVFPDLPGRSPHSNFYDGVTASKLCKRQPVKLIPLGDDELVNEKFELKGDGSLECSDGEIFALGEKIDVQSPKLHMARKAGSDLLAVDVTERDCWESFDYWRSRRGQRGVQWLTHKDGQWHRVRFAGPLWLRVMIRTLTICGLTGLGAAIGLALGL